MQDDKKKDAKPKSTWREWIFGKPSPEDEAKRKKQEEENAMVREALQQSLKGAKLVKPLTKKKDDE